MDRLRHPNRAFWLAQFPREGLNLDPVAIRDAIETQLNTHETTPHITHRPSREGERPITGTSRILRSQIYPFTIYTSYKPDGLSPIPDREVYRAMSLPKEYEGMSVELAEGLWIVGEKDKYSALVQAFDPTNPRTTRSFSYEANRGVIPPSAPDNHRVAAMRSLTRLGLI